MVGSGHEQPAFSTSVGVLCQKARLRFHRAPPHQTSSHRRSISISASALSRRQAIVTLSGSLLATIISPSELVAPAHATNGLRIFPLTEPLGNSYYFMRACETVSDKLNVINSNPVNKLSLKMHSLTPDGVDQAVLASSALIKAGVGSGAWIWPSVTISAFETAEILASRLRVRREQLVPEFSFLDMRGVGLLEGGKVNEVRNVIKENDQRDTNWRPPAGEDGTPNDSTEDVFVRVRQLLAKLETQYYAEDVIILAPDSDPLSILQAAITGKDLKDHHQFEYQPGEVRFIRELVVDAYGNTVVEPDVRIISKPIKVKKMKA